MDKVKTVVKALVKSKSFWTLAGAIALAVGTPAGSTIVSLVGGTVCTVMGGCV